MILNQIAAGGGGDGASANSGLIEADVVTVYASATPHVKGSWWEIIAATSADADAVWLDVSDVAQSGSATGTLLDLAVGAEGSEVPFLENLPVGSAPTYYGVQYLLPVAVASGSRVVARIQSVMASRTADVGVALLSGTGTTPGTLTVLGASTATSRGTETGTGWTEIATTATDYSHLVIGLSASAAVLSNVSQGVAAVASGASGSESEIGRIVGRSTTGEQVTSAYSLPSWAVGNIWPGVPSGTRLSGKLTGFSNNLDMAVIGVT